MFLPYKKLSVVNSVYMCMHNGSTAILYVKMSYW